MGAVMVRGFVPAKTTKMAEIELLDAVQRNRPRRDIREILSELWVEEFSFGAMAERLGVDGSTISVWLRVLRGRLEGKGAAQRLVFEDFPAPSAASGERAAAA